jgi:hypothetical protein
MGPRKVFPRIRLTGGLCVSREVGASLSQVNKPRQIQLSSFSKTVVVRYRMHLDSRHLAPGTINLRLGAVRGFGVRGGRVWPPQCRFGRGNQARQGGKDT